MTNDIFKFGYGDILVDTNFISLKLYHINNKLDIGRRYKDADELPNYEILNGYEIQFFSVPEVDKFISMLKDVLLDKLYLTFEFKGVTFDFTNWNEKSIQICIDAALKIRSWFIIPTAC